MEYKHTDFDNSVNSPTQSHFFELIKYLAGFAVFVAVLYFSLGLISSAIIPYISPKTERSLWGNYANGKLAKSFGEEVQDNKKLQQLLDSIPKDGLPDYGGYKIFILKDEEPNAFAAAGGYIFVTTGLLEMVKSENALVFILGHELGHFKNRDQLKGLGRGLAIMLVQLLLFGQDTSALSDGTYGFELALSRQQEEEADKVGLSLLNKKYGQCAGAFELFEKLNEKHKSSKYLKYFSTHPHDEDRIKTLQKLIKKQNCQIKDITPLSL